MYHTLNVMPVEKRKRKKKTNISFYYNAIWASLVAQLVKNPPAIQETPVRFLDREDPLEKG